MNNPLQHILLVDDDLPTNFIHERLISIGKVANEVTAAYNVQDAIKLLDSIQPDLILLDINMPELSGWDFLDLYKMKNHIDGNSARIFMVTTSIDPKDKERAASYKEITEFMSKPVTLEVLKQKVEEHF